MTLTTGDTASRQTRRHGSTRTSSRVAVPVDVFTLRRVVEVLTDAPGRARAVRGTGRTASPGCQRRAGQARTHALVRRTRLVRLHEDPRPTATQAGPRQALVPALLLPLAARRARSARRCCTPGAWASAPAQALAREPEAGTRQAWVAAPQRTQPAHTGHESTARRLLEEARGKRPAEK
jgi:hypothetical protein